MTTTIISSTNRPGSITLRLAEYYSARLLEKGLETNLLSLTQMPGDFLVSDLYGKRSAAFEPMQQLITQSAKFLFVIPEYNGSFPGVLKLFMDGCTFPDSFYEKKAALVGLSSGKYGNIRGLDHFTGVCHYMHLHLLPLKIHIPTIKSELDENGRIYKEDTLKFTDEQMDKFIQF